MPTFIDVVDAPADERFAFPTPETRLDHGDKIIVFGPQDAVESLTRKAR